MLTFCFGTCKKGVNCPYKHKRAEKAQGEAAAAEEREKTPASKTNATRVKGGAATETIRGRQGLPAPRPKTNCALSKVAKVNPMEEIVGEISKIAVPTDDRCDRVRMRYSVLTTEEREKKSLDLKAKMIEALTEGRSETRVRMIRALTKGADPEKGA